MRIIVYLSWLAREKTNYCDAYYNYWVIKMYIAMMPCEEIASDKYELICIYQ